MKCEVTSLRMGDVIDLQDEVNSENVSYPVLGLNKDKSFMPTVANLSEVNLQKYKVVRKGWFAYSGMQTGRDVCIRIARYAAENPALISPAYTTFTIKSEFKGHQLLPDYVFMFFNREESDRYGAFISDSSVRANLDWPRFCDIEIPVPDMETQQRLVAVWSGLDGMKHDNDAQAAPLMELCMSYLKKLREEYPLRALSDNLIERVERFNSNAILGIDSVRGVSNTKEIIQTRANVSGREVKDFLVLNHHEFIFNRRTTRNGERLGLGFNESDTPILFTNDYVMFKVKDEDVLLPEFLYLCFKRDEFDRYVRWDSWGSATEFFNWENMQRVRIPIPPKAIQQAIVDIYTCAKECRDIAEQADNLRRVAGPALMQKAIHP